MSARWSPAEDDRIRAVYADRTTRKLPALRPLAVELGRGLHAVRRRAIQLGCTRATRRQAWTVERDALVTTLYGLVDTRDLAVQLASTPASVRQRAVALGLHSHPNREARIRALLDEGRRLRVLLAVRLDMVSVVDAARVLGVAPDRVVALARTEAVAGARVVGNDRGIPR